MKFKSLVLGSVLALGACDAKISEASTEPISASASSINQTLSAEESSQKLSLDDFAERMAVDSERAREIFSVHSTVCARVLESLENTETLLIVGRTANKGLLILEDDKLYLDENVDGHLDAVAELSGQALLPIQKIGQPNLVDEFKTTEPTLGDVNRFRGNLLYLKILNKAKNPCVY